MGGGGVYLDYFYLQGKVIRKIGANYVTSQIYPVLKGF